MIAPVRRHQRSCLCPSVRGHLGGRHLLALLQGLGTRMCRAPVSSSVVIQARVRSLRPVVTRRVPGRDPHLRSSQTHPPHVTEDKMKLWRWERSSPRLLSRGFCPFPPPLTYSLSSFRPWHEHRLLREAFPDLQDSRSGPEWRVPSTPRFSSSSLPQLQSGNPLAGETLGIGTIPPQRWWPRPPCSHVCAQGRARKCSL